MEIVIVFWGFLIMIACIFGTITRAMAESRGRSKVAAFWWGFFFNFWAIIGYLIAGDTEEKKIKRMKQALKED